MGKSYQLNAESLIAGYDGKNILKDIDIAIPEGKISVIIGPNACGKSTLLKTLSRIIKPISGHVVLNGKDIFKMHPKKLAKVIGMLPQSPIVPEGIKVVDLVGRGRYPHQSFLGTWTKNDYEAVAEAMEIMDIGELANRDIDELSGGQRQRVWIAMVLAQQPEILFLDEPTTFLDITYQIEILDLLTEYNQKNKTTIVMVLHDINLSSRYADYIFALQEGKLVTQGTPREVISKENIKKVFHLDAYVTTDVVSNLPSISPIGKYHTVIRDDNH